LNNAETAAPKKSRMWRSRVALLFVSIAAMTSVVAAACGDDDDTGADTTATSETTATAGASATAGADEVKLGDLTISGAWVRTTTNDVTAAYMTIKSAGDADTLVKASSPISGMVQLHEVITEGSSSKMQEKPGGFEVPANGMVELKPGGFHIMLMDVKDAPAEGSMVELTLTFEKAGEVTIKAPVQAGTGASADMGGMSGGMASPTAGH